MLGNVSIRIGPTSSPEVTEVAGRGELQLAVLIESMRREGFEMQVSRPEVILREIDGKPHEPVERAVVDVPDEHVGTVTQAVAPRKGKRARPETGRPRSDHRHPHRPRPRFARVPIAAHDRNPGNGPDPSTPRRLDALGGRPAPSPGRGDDLGPDWNDHRLCPRQPPEARRAIRGCRRRRLRGNDHRRGSRSPKSFPPTPPGPSSSPTSARSTPTRPSSSDPIAATPSRPRSNGSPPTSWSRSPRCRSGCASATLPRRIASSPPKTLRMATDRRV